MQAYWIIIGKPPEPWKTVVWGKWMKCECGQEVRGKEEIWTREHECRKCREARKRMREYSAFGNCCTMFKFEFLIRNKSKKCKQFHKSPFVATQSLLPLQTSQRSIQAVIYMPFLRIDTGVKEQALQLIAEGWLWLESLVGVRAVLYYGYNHTVIPPSAITLEPRATPRVKRVEPGRSNSIRSCPTQQGEVRHLCSQKLSFNDSRIQRELGRSEW